MANLTTEAISTSVGSPITYLLAESEADQIALAKSRVMNNPSVVSEEPTKAATVAAPPVVQSGSVVPFTTIQEAVNSVMLSSLSIPTFNVGYTVTTDALFALYKEIKPKGVTMTALITKATAMALKQHPVVNSCCRDGKSFTFNSSINVAVVVAVDGGLVTPVLRDADKIDIYSLSKTWRELVVRARAKQLQPQECSTGTFTLSNLGMCGSVDWFNAILPPGTGAIISVGASRPAVVGTKDGRIRIENQMKVTVTADHRIIYGADLAAFLQTLAQIIEDPKDLFF